MCVNQAGRCLFDKPVAGDIIASFSVKEACSLFTVRAALLSAVLAVLIFGLAPRGFAQIQDDTSGSIIPGTHQRDDPWTAQHKRDMEKKLNEQREQNLKKDTEKLLELATELKQYVDKTNENTMSMDVIKKAEQIEKLAKSVKEKMKGSN